MGQLMDTAEGNLSREGLISEYDSFKAQHALAEQTQTGQKFINAIERNGLSSSVVEAFKGDQAILAKMQGTDEATQTELLKAMDTYKGQLGPHIEAFAASPTSETLQSITGTLSSPATTPASTPAPQQSTAPETSEPISLIAETALPQSAPAATSSAPRAAAAVPSQGVEAPPKSNADILMEYGTKMNDFVSKNYPGEFNEADLAAFQNKLLTDPELQASVLDQMKKNPGLLKSFDQLDGDSPSSLAARNALRPYITDAIENPDVLKNPNFMKGAQGAARAAASEEMGSGIMDGFMKNIMGDAGMGDLSMNGILDMFKPLLASMGINLDNLMNGNTMLASNGGGGEMFNNFIGAMSGNQMASNTILDVDNNRVYNVASAPDGEMRITGEDGKLLKPPVRNLAMSDPGLSAGGPIG